MNYLPTIRRANARNWFMAHSAGITLNTFPIDANIFTLSIKGLHTHTHTATQLRQTNQRLNDWTHSSEVHKNSAFYFVVILSCTFTLYQTFSSWVIKATILHFDRDERERHAFGCGVFAVFLHSLTFPYVWLRLILMALSTWTIRIENLKKIPNSYRFECKSVREDGRIKQSENHTSDKFSSIKPALKFPGIREFVCRSSVSMWLWNQDNSTVLQLFRRAKKVQWSSVEPSKKWRIFIALLLCFISSTSTRLKTHTTWMISNFLFSVCISFRNLHALNSSFRTHPSWNLCVCMSALNHTFHMSFSSTCIKIPRFYRTK